MSDDMARLVLRSFRGGYDTSELARLFDLPEARVVELLRLARNMEKAGK